MSTTLIFNDTLKGHRLEYFHHLYVGACEKTDTSFVFSYPESDKDLLKEYDWPEHQHIKMVSMPSFPEGGGLRDIWKKNKVLSGMVKSIKPSRVILIDVMGHLPFLPLLVRKTKVYGVIYGIYLYTWKQDPFRVRVAHIFKYFIFSRFPVFDKIFIQSDSSAAANLNTLYHTRKFQYICDPIVPIDKSNIKDIREELKIPIEKKIVLHPGDLSRRKGTIALLKGLVECSSEILDNYYFIFAGRVSSQCKNEFADLFNKIKEKTKNIQLIEGFLSFDYLGSLICTSDILFIPYQLTNQSSGIVSYAAEFSKPAIVTKEGLLGKIVKKNHLGIVIKDSSPTSIKKILKEGINWSPSENLFIESNSVKEFYTTLYC